MIGTVVYKIDGTCYYVTSLNNQTVMKFEEGEKRNKVIKKLSYEFGPPGGLVTSPEGTGKTAMLVPADSDEAVEEVTEDAPV